jgi:hypothetical protein
MLTKKKLMKGVKKMISILVRIISKMGLHTSPPIKKLDLLEFSLKSSCLHPCLWASFHLPIPSLSEVYKSKEV